MSTTAYKFFRVKVINIEDITPSIRRFSFQGPDTSFFKDPGFDQRIKLILPTALNCAQLAAQFSADPDWFSVWRQMPTELRPPIRTYTTRYVHGDIVVIDMVRHEPLGPASKWINTATAGAEVLLLGPNKSSTADAGGIDFIPPEKTDNFLLAGDETAAPAIARILEDLPASACGHVVLEMPCRADAHYLPNHSGFEITFVDRKSANEKTHGELLVTTTCQKALELVPQGKPHTVTEIDVDQELLWEVPRHAKGGAALTHTSLYAWIAGEANAVKLIRRYLVAERGIDRRAVAFMGYWRLGKAEN